MWGGVRGLMTTQALLQHRNGSTWVVVDSLAHQDSPAALSALTDAVSAQTGEPVLGFRNAISDGPWGGGAHMQTFMTGFRVNPSNMDVMRDTLRASGDVSPGVADDNYASAKFAALLTQRRVHLLEVRQPKNDL